MLCYVMLSSQATKTSRTTHIRRWTTTFAEVYCTRRHCGSPAARDGREVCRSRLVSFHYNTIIIHRGTTTVISKHDSTISMIEIDKCVLNHWLEWDHSRHFRVVRGYAYPPLIGVGSTAPPLFTSCHNSGTTVVGYYSTSQIL